MHSLRPLLFVVLALVLAACEGDPAEASVTNGLASGVLEKVWFRTTLFAGPIAPGQSSEVLRIGTGTEHAYAVVRIGERAFVAKSSEPVSAEAGESVRIVFTEATSRSICFGAPPLDAEEHAFVTSRIFPGEVVEGDPARCTSE